MKLQTSKPDPVGGDVSDQVVDGPADGIALCLSGGGYRAMLFHVGTLWRLNDAGYLPKLDRVSSVSGGSITAGVIGLHWGRLAFDDGGFAHGFQTHVVEPIRAFARHTVDLRAIFGAFFIPGQVGKNVAKAYRSRLFGRNTLQALPDRPRFVINATNVQSGVLWRFSKPYMRDYRVGEVKSPDTELAVAVAASSAFPPVLSPLILRLSESQFSPPDKEDLHEPPFTTRVVLTDGGVYDNLGLQPAWDRYKTILVSDAGGATKPSPKPGLNWLSHAFRTLFIIDNQVRSLRKRNLIASYISAQRTGAYWGIRSDITNYAVADALTCPFKATVRLADISTRLKRLDELTQERIINWGYAVCDAAMRRHVDPSLQAPGGFPFPNAGVG